MLLCKIHLKNTFLCTRILHVYIGGMGRFKGGLKCKEWVNSVIINVITEINYKCNYI